MPLQRLRALLAPPKQISIPDWIEENFRLSPESSATPGRIKLFEYQKGWAEAVGDDNVERVTVQKAARLGYSVVLDGLLLYYLAHDPSPCLVVLPRESDAEDLSRSEIVPAIRDCPAMSLLAGDMNRRDALQRINARFFRNGSSVRFVGASSPASFRRLTIRCVFLDEVSGFPVGGAGDEGDQVNLAITRTQTFANRKIIMGSTPTIKGECRISKSYEESDQRQFFVKCPHCGEAQTLKWSGIHWDQDVEGNHKPETSVYICENGCVISESNKPAMVEGGAWRAARPFTGHAGFKISALYSLSPNARWQDIVKEFLLAKGDALLLQTWTNVVLGDTWEQAGETVDSSSLIRRVENYTSKNVPLPVSVLTAGIDVQENRIEAQCVGWGPREESWVLDYQIFHGSPAEPKVWAEIDRWLYGKYIREDGTVLTIKAAGIDTGGHFGAAVYGFCRQRVGRNIYPIKGVELGRIWPRVAKRNKASELIYNIGTAQAKDLLYAHLRMDGKGGPGFVHFCAGVCDEEYFKQLTSETCQTVRKMGRAKRVWVLKRNTRNEVLDCFVYALAVFKSFPRSDSMMTPPRPHIVDAEGKTIPPKNASITVFDIDNPFPQKVIERKVSRGSRFAH